MTNIPAIRRYAEKHVFNHVYRDSNGQLRTPKFLGAVVFPSGKSWSLHSINGAQYTIESYASKSFKPLSLDYVAAHDGVILFHDKPIAFHCYFHPNTPTYLEIQKGINEGTITVLKPIAEFKA